MEIEEFLKKLEYVTSNIKSIVLETMDSEAYSMSIIKNFIPAYRIFKKHGYSFLFNDVKGDIRNKFDLNKNDDKTIYLLKTRTIRFLDALIKQEYISMRKSDEDKRISIYFFTEKAIKMFDKFEKIIINDNIG